MDVSFLNEPHPGLEVRASPLRSGPRKTEVPRTSCAVYRSNSAELQSYCVIIILMIQLSYVDCLGVESDNRR